MIRSFNFFFSMGKEYRFDLKLVTTSLKTYRVEVHASSYQEFDVKLDRSWSDIKLVAFATTHDGNLTLGQRSALSGFLSDIERCSTWKDFVSYNEYLDNAVMQLNDAFFRVQNLLRL